MKKTHYLFLLLFLLPFLGKTQNWQPLGPDDFNQASFGDSQYSAISTTTAVPYVAFVYAYKKIKVRRFVANKWETVSDGVFSGNNSSKVKIVFDGTTPYVAYRESINDGKLTVKKQVGTDWELVGTAGISGKNIQKIDFVIDNGIPYVAYTDADSQRKLMVKKFNGTSWVSVGSGDVSDIYADYPSLTLDENHTPYVVYRDSTYRKTWGAYSFPICSIVSLYRKFTVFCFVSIGDIRRNCISRKAEIIYRSPCYS